MLVRGLFGISTILVSAGCSSGDTAASNNNGQTGAGTGGTSTGGATPTSTTTTGGATSSGGTTTVPSGGAGAASAGGSTSAGPCAYKCTDFCLNSGGEKIPGSCTKAGFECCNVKPTETTVTGKEFYIDAANGNDSNDGTSPEKAWKSSTKIASAGSGAVVNLKRGRAWQTTGAINQTNVTVRPYGTGPRPVINGTSIVVPQSLGTLVLKGNAKCGSVPDIGAVEYCENSATKARSDEIARCLELNK